MANFTLDDIRDAADKKYGGLVIELGDEATVTLRNVLRMPKEQRKELQALEERDTDGVDEMMDTVSDIIMLVADSHDNASALLEAIGDDDASLIQLLRMWQEQTQAGEAEPSKS